MYTYSFSKPGDSSGKSGIEASLSTKSGLNANVKLTYSQFTPDQQTIQPQSQYSDQSGAQQQQPLHRSVYLLDGKPQPWKDTTQQRQYFQDIRKAGLLNEKHYGASEKAWMQNQRLEKSQVILKNSQILETGKKILPSGAEYDPNKCYYRDPEIVKIAEIGRQYCNLDWRDPGTQQEYFRALRETGLLNTNFYGTSEEDFEEKLHLIKDGAVVDEQGREILSGKIKLTPEEVQKAFGNPDLNLNLRDSRFAGISKQAPLSLRLNLHQSGDWKSQDPKQYFKNLKDSQLLPEKFYGSPTHQSELKVSQSISRTLPLK